MANEEINIAITKKFFPDKCWHDWKHDKGLSDGDFYGFECSKCMQVTYTPRHLNERPQNPDYCGNIGDAWKILEALALSGYYFLLSVDLNEKTLAGIYKNKKCISQELEQNPAMAICKAALEIEVENE